MLWTFLINAGYRLPQWLSGKEICLQCRRRNRSHGFDPWVGKIPWRKKGQQTAVFFSGKFHGQRSLVGYGPWGCKRVRHNLATKQQQQQNYVFLLPKNSTVYLFMSQMCCFYLICSIHIWPFWSLFRITLIFLIFSPIIADPFHLSLPFTPLLVLRIASLPKLLCFNPEECPSYASAHPLMTRLSLYLFPYICRTGTKLFQVVFTWPPFPAQAITLLQMVALVK